MIKELDYTQVRKTCPDDFITCQATSELEPLAEIIGQDRALKALQFGLDIKVLLVDEEGNLVQQQTVRDLLPGAFLPQDLRE